MEIIEKVKDFIKFQDKERSVEVSNKEIEALTSTLEFQKSQLRERIEAKSKPLIDECNRKRYELWLKMKSEDDKLKQECLNKIKDLENEALPIEEGIDGVLQKFRMLKTQPKEEEK